MTPVISVNQVTRIYRSTIKEEGWKGTFNLLVRPQIKEHPALKGVSFQIEPGEFVGLIGANGAGKTTLLKILSGLIPASSGETRVLGENPFNRSLNFRRQISLVMGQKAQLWWDLPALEAFDLLRAVYAIPHPVYRDRLKQLTELLDVGKLLKTQIRKLSLGERMKMELMGAILHWPKVIFLDEPTIGLDVLAAHRLREFLKSHNQKEGATLLLTSHNTEDIAKLCNRVMILREGHIIFDGSPTRLIQNQECQLRIRFHTSPTFEALKKATGLESDPEKGEDGNFLFNIDRSKILPTLQSLMLHFEVADIGIDEPSLDRVIQNIFATPGIALT